MQADLNEIYNQLFAGKRLQFHFDTPDAAEYFRVRMAQFKKRQEDNLQAAGFLDSSDVQAFSFQKDARTGNWVALFKAKRVVQTYKILALEDE